MRKPYSDWFRIDLHIHTDWSRKTKEGDYNGDFSVTTLKQKLTENEVGVFSLTDHNIINIDAYREYYESYDETVDPLLLVGVELDILVTVSRDRTYHTLLIFNYSSAGKAQEIHDALEGKYAEKGLSDKERLLTISEVVELFPDDDFFFIPHAGNTKSIVDGYRGNIEDAQEMVLLMQSAFEKVPEKAQQKYNEGFDSRLNEAFRDRQNYAYLRFSDNHKIEGYPCPNKGDDGRTHSFYYVKGGRGFETLRLAFIDPASRIKSSEDFARVRNSIRFLESVEIQGLRGFEDRTLMFSPHLNVVIGGRSSGKSLLMYLLGKKIDSISEKADGYENIDLNSVQIKSYQDASLCRETSISSDKVTYIKQGEIVRYFEEGDLRELAKYTGHIAAHDSARSSIIDHKNRLEYEIGHVVAAYGHCHDGGSGRHVLHQSTIDSLLSDSFTFRLDAGSVGRGSDLAEEIQQGVELIAGLERDIDEFGKSELFELTDDETELTNSFLTLIGEKKELVIGKSAVVNRRSIFLESVVALVDDANAQLDSDARSKAEARVSLEQLISSIGGEFDRLLALKEASDSLEAFDCQAEEKFTISAGVSLVLIASKNIEESMKELLLDGLRHGDCEISLYRNLVKVLRGVVGIKNYQDTEAESLRRKIQRQLAPYFESFDAPAEYLEYSDGEISLDKSPGYNSEKYLTIVLSSRSTELIFIDQPEDNLGNVFITETLVDMIRQLKFKKQIFLVTHNPSVVVHGDAENVIIATNVNNTIRYKQVVIENETSQKEICKILDGGEYIFDRRSQKYNIKKLIRERSHE